MYQAANAYSRMSQTALPPRELEATALMRAATRLQAIQDDWAGKATDLSGALTYNRKLWTILATSATAEENPLPTDVKIGIAKLAAFVFKQTFALMGAPDVAKIKVLVDINREIAAGLRTTPRAAA